MKFMVMHKHDKNTEAGLPPPPELIAAMGALIGGMAHSGQLLDGEGLGASETRSRLTFKGGECTVLHGPYTGSNELPAGFAKVTVQSREEAIAIATQIGEAIGGDLEIEVGKVNEPWDIGIGDKPADAPLRYLILPKATPASESGQGANINAVVAELARAGTPIEAATLAPSSRAKRLQWRGGSRKIVDGPFLESKELIGGYAILDMASMQECLGFCTKYAEILLTAAEGLEIDVRPL